MNFTITKSELFRMLSKLKGIPKRSSSMAVLSHLHVMTAGEDLFITATDLEVAVRVKTLVEVFDEGAVALPGDPLFRIVQKMPDGNISFEAETNNRVRISGGSARFSLAGLAGEEFPEFPDVMFKERLTLPSKTLQDMLEKTLFAVSKNEGMVSLAGVFTVMCGNNGDTMLCMVATDGHRLAKVEIASSQQVPVLQEGVIIPVKGGMELLRMARETDENLELRIDKNTVSASLSNETLVIRLLNGRFPDYGAVTRNIDGIPVVSDRESLGECLERIYVMAHDHTRHVSLNLSGKDYMEMKSSNRDLGDAEDQVHVRTRLEELSVGFNAGYLLQGLKVMKSREVTILLKDGRSPALLTGEEDKGFSYVIMPLAV